METLSIITRGNSSTKRKPKIYISYHPKDKDLIKDIAEDILSFYDCAIFYCENYENITDIEEHFQNLLGMNLFVMIITSNYLNDNNFALDTEFSFAKKVHLPLLPLMQESNLDYLFNQKCGDLQYLNKNVITDNEIPFEEKLQKFLDSVLYKDDLVNKIKSSFDGYIFLSYRKKDRKHAQRLMKLIHENDFCRDVAIWYDEFLIPGENFNDMIAEVLNKSDIVALAITPNIVNEPNYIMSIEYPLAKKIGKVIIPAELVPTNISELKEKYEGLSSIVNVNDFNLLTKSLSEALSNLKLRNKDNDPLHNYFIGLAYLYGIDVEKNVNRGSFLIISSATNNCIDAIKKLVSMYLNGDGVNKDYNQAIVWQKKLVDIYKNTFRSSYLEKDAINYFEEENRLAEFYFDIEDYEKSKNIYNQKIQLLYTLMPNPQTQFKCLTSELAATFGYLGDIFKNLGDYETAIVYYKSSNEIFEMLDQSEHTTLYKRRLSQSYMRLAGIYQNNANFKEAFELYEKSLNLNKENYDRNNDINSKTTLVLSYGNLGDFLLEINQTEDALNHYKQAVELAISLVEESRNNLAKRVLSLSYIRLANALKDLKQFDEALKYYQKANSIDLSLIDDVDTIKAQETLALSYASISLVLNELKQFDNAIDYVNKAIEINTGLIEKTQGFSFKLSLEINYYNLYLIYQQLNDLNNQYNCLLKAKVLFVNLSNNSNSLEVKNYLGKTYLAMADILNNGNKIIEAIKNYEEANQIFYELMNSISTLEVIDNLAKTYYLLGSLHYKNNNLNSAFNGLNQAYTVYKTLIDETKSPYYYQKYANTSYALAKVLYDMNIKDQVFNLLNDAYKILSILIEKYPEMDTLKYEKNEVEIFLNKIR